MRGTLERAHAVLWTCALIGAPTGLAAQGEAPATGFSISARVAQSSLNELVASASGGPEFTLGHRGERFSIGVGVGLSHLRVTDRDDFGATVSEDRSSATLFQIGPDVLVSVWESPDRRTQGNVSLGATVGRLSATDESTFTGSPPNESKVSGTLWGLRAGLGGEHFFDRHFAIGVEGGFQTTFATGVEEEGSTTTVGVGAAGAYGALRVTVVLGSGG